MPKVLEYLITGICWILLFGDTDSNENRAHVNIGRKVGKKASIKLCKIWLEPEVEIATKGDLTEAQAKQVLELSVSFRKQLLEQWNTFKTRGKIKIIKIRKK